MAWDLKTKEKLRLEFIVDHDRGLYSMTELCELYGISRDTGYVLLRRWNEEGAVGLRDRSRRPIHPAHQTASETVEKLLAARKGHPTWGPRKLLLWLEKRHPNVSFPAPSTAGELLKRNGMITPRRRRRTPIEHPGKPTTVATRPNQLWAADFKGQFLTRDGVYCYPLTVTDQHSRFLLGCKGLLSPNEQDTRRAFERLFREYGLPDAIRTDNGSPFASIALGRLSRLSVWWIKLGIRPELTQPSHPEQNGQHERMHRTMKAETTRPPAPHLRGQQRVFDAFRKRFNQERPHEALAMNTPASIYASSPRPFPSKIEPPAYPAHFEVRRVSQNHGIRWNTSWINVSSTLCGEFIGLEEIDDAIWSVYFGPVLLGRFDERDLRIYGVRNL